MSKKAVTLFCVLLLTMSTWGISAIADCSGIDFPGDDRCMPGEGAPTQWGADAKGYSLGIVLDKTLPSPKPVGSPRLVNILVCIKNDTRSPLVVNRDELLDFSIVDTQVGNPPIVRLGLDMYCYTIPPPQTPRQQISILPGHARVYPSPFQAQPGYRYVFKAEGMLRPIGQAPIDLESGYLSVNL
jgi:hypothetical protein